MNPGPNVNKIASTVPGECSVDQAVYVVRHGSRYPDPGAYQEWENLHEAVGSQLWISLLLNIMTQYHPVPIRRLSRYRVAELHLRLESSAEAPRPRD